MRVDQVILTIQSKSEKKELETMKL